MQQWLCTHSLKHNAIPYFFFQWQTAVQQVGTNNY